MTKNRNIYADQAATASIVQDGNPMRPEVQSRPNWLGHRGGNASIDEALIKGATNNEMSQYRGAVDEHLRHLKQEHGLNILKLNVTYQLT
jgi:hypothetical protein